MRELTTILTLIFPMMLGFSVSRCNRYSQKIDDLQFELKVRKEKTDSVVNAVVRDWYIEQGMIMDSLQRRIHSLERKLQRNGVPLNDPLEYIEMEQPDETTI